MVFDCIELKCENTKFNCTICNIITPSAAQLGNKCRSLSEGAVRMN